ncbi:MAG TPA: universal stress protein [Solirubrobacteraceae bacterium]|nr:universal stress protein [Solirubrobacteraceae bacterium]
MTTSPAPSEPPADVRHFARVLCAIDGSRGGAEAVREALTLCDPAGVVRFVAVTDVRGTGPTRMASVGEYRAGQALAAARALATDRGVRAEIELAHDDDVAGALLARAAGYDLLALGSHRESRLGGIATGSTATAIAHRAEGPVLVARPAAAGAPPFPSHVVVALADDRDGSTLVETAGALAAQHGAHVHLVCVAEHALGQAEHHRIAWLSARLREMTGVEPLVSTPPGVPHEAIADVARHDGASLVVVGRRGLSGVRALGSVSERVVHTAPCSVLVLPTPARPE